MPDVTHAPMLAQLDEESRTEFWACLALRHTAGLGGRSFKRLLDVFGTAYAAVKSAPHWEGSGIAIAKAHSVASGAWRTSARAEWDAVRACGCGILLWTDAHYPARLRELPDPPLFLYALGDIGLLANPALGVVGARLCSREGLRITTRIVRQLTRAGVTIVSGLARGIDREAHLAGLEGIGGTIGVLGTGIDVRYPRDNMDLFYAMESRGLILTEFGPGTRPDPRNFPIRNRVISGLSLGVLVVEAATRSGSLITARLALEQGREVYAIPGSLSAQTSRGCHDLIREGAHPVFEADDILRDLAPQLQADLLASSRKAEEGGPTEGGSCEPESSRIERADMLRAGLARVGLTKDALLHTRAVTDAVSQNVCGGEMRSANPDTSQAHSGHVFPVDVGTDTDAGIGAGIGTGTGADTGLGTGARPGLGDMSMETGVARGARTGTEAGTGTGTDTDAGTNADMNTSMNTGMDADAQRILQLLEALGEAHIDVLSRELGMPSGVVSGALLLLEVQDRVRRLPGMRYARI